MIHIYESKNSDCGIYLYYDIWDSITSQKLSSGNIRISHSIFRKVSTSEVYFIKTFEALIAFRVSFGITIIDDNFDCKILFLLNCIEFNKRPQRYINFFQNASRKCLTYLLKTSTTDITVLKSYIDLQDI